MNYIKNIVSKLKNMPIGAKASIAFLFVSVLQKGMSFITTPIFTNMLSQSEFGTVSVYYSWMQLISIVAMFSLSTGVFNNGMIDFKDDRDNFVSSMVSLSLVITSVTAVIFFALWSKTSEYMGMTIPLAILMFIKFFTQPAMSFWTARQRYEYKYKASTLASVLYTVLSLLVAVIAIPLFTDKVSARIFGAESVMIAFYIFFLVLVLKKTNFKTSTKYWKYAIAFNLPLLPHYLSSFILSNSDRIMISSIVGDAEAGIYTVAFSVSSVLTILWTAINSSLLPSTYENCEKKNFSRIKEITTPILVIFSLACMLIILLAPELISLLSTKEYANAIYVVAPLVGGVFFQVVYSLYSNVVYYYKKPKNIMLVSVLSAVLNIVLNAWLIPIFGYIAAGYTTIFCYMLQAILDYKVLRRITKEDIYNNEVIIYLSMFILMLACFSGVFYFFAPLRYIFISVLLIVAIIKRKTILKVIKSR